MEKLERFFLEMQNGFLLLFIDLGIKKYIYSFTMVLTIFILNWKLEQAYKKVRKHILLQMEYLNLHTLSTSKCLKAAFKNP